MTEQGLTPEQLARYERLYGAESENNAVWEEQPGAIINDAAALYEEVLRMTARIEKMRNAHIQNMAMAARRARWAVEHNGGAS